VRKFRRKGPQTLWREAFMEESSKKEISRKELFSQEAEWLCEPEKRMKMG